MDYIEEAKNIIPNLNQRMGPSPYDIAWLARLRTSNNGSARWPDLIEWLQEHQHPDGSWGSPIVYYHDRIICTVAALIALAENGRTHQAQQTLKRAERYLWQHLHLLPRDPFELVGFELLLPTLLNQAQMLGLDVPNHTCGYSEIQTAKLRLIPSDMLYSPKLTTVHSLEFMGRSGDPQKLRQALAINGSLGNSPAATAYYLLLSGQDENAINYLENVRCQTNQVVIVYPFRTFETTWVLNNLSYSGLPVTQFANASIWESLRAEVAPYGVGADVTFGIPDGDTTSVCCRLLRCAGYDVDPSILAQYENPESHIFRTYHYERNASASTNIHALEALGMMPDYPNNRQVREQIIIALLDRRKYKIYWVDKWHTSPYYTTAHAIVALLREGAYLVHACHNTVDWLLHTQKEDGSWGFFEYSTMEETAYVLTALLYYHRHTPINTDILHRGANYLARMYQTYKDDPSAYPALWIEKCLYVPYDIVRSAIVAALMLYTSIFG